MTRNEPRLELAVLSANYVQMALGIIDMALLGAFDMKADGPRIVAINSGGQKFVVGQYKSKREAKRTASEMRAEMERVGGRAWCMEHRVPLGFLR
jgi:hypothetical protein